MNHQQFVQLVDVEIDTIPLQEKLSDPDVGAHGWFYGVTRRTTVLNRTADFPEEKITQTLSYEAHRSMALKQLKNLAQRAADQFELKNIVIVHRLGEVPIGQASVVVGCSSAHRVATFRALEWIMKVLKKDVPIWKQESYADGTTEWVHPVDSGK